MTDKTTSAIDLLALAERCEAATAEQQTELLREAYYAIFPEPDKAEEIFDAKIEAGAFVDAALTLVPDGIQWAISKGDFATVGVVGMIDDEENVATAKTPALAICAAALRARASLENGQ